MFKNSTPEEIDSNAATLTVKTEAPKVSKQPVSLEVLAGAPAKFEAAASGAPAPTVQWQVSTNKGVSWANDTTDEGVTTDTLTLAATSLAESGNEYRAVFENSAGKAESNGATLTVKEAPKVTKQPVSLEVLAGAPAKFEAAASGAPAPTVQWQVSTNKGVSWANDTTDEGVTTDTLTLAATTHGENGNEYRAVFENSAGKAESNGATLTVKEAPKVTKQPVSLEVLAGAPAKFEAAASGAPAPTVQWQVSTNKGVSWANDTTDEGVTTDTLTLAATSLAESGNEYRAVFENSAGKAESNGATLTVKEAPKVTKQPVSLEVLAGAPAKFEAAASGAPAPTVQWQVSTNKGVSWANDTTDEGVTTDTLPFSPRRPTARMAMSTVRCLKTVRAKPKATGRP